MSSDLAFVFRVIEGLPLPHRLNEGESIDGAKILDPAQVAEKFGGTAEEWKAKWGRLLAHVVQTAGYVQADDDLENTRRVRFPHVKEDRHWEFVKEDCRRRGIDVRDIWVEMKFNHDRDELEPVIITTIQALRQIGDRTGLRNGESMAEYLGADGVWKEAWVGHEIPVRARVKVWRKDQDNPYVGEALWDRCAQFTVNTRGEKLYNEAWEPTRGGCEQLGKCAAAAAYRKAFPQQTGGIALREERLFESPKKKVPAMRVDAQTSEAFDAETGEVVATAVFAPTPTAPEIVDDPRAWIDKVSESTPGLSRLPIELVYENAATSPKDAKEVIDKWRRKLPRLYAHPDQRYFCAAVLEAAGAMAGAAG